MADGFDKKYKTKPLSEDDKQLWKRVTDTIKPIQRRQDVLSSAEELTLADMMASTATNPQPKPTNPKNTPMAPFLDAYHPPVSKPNRSTLSQDEIDRKTRRKIAKGTTPLGARLDMHGMTQDRAHSALINFVRSSQGQGHRHVLVITGKGRSLKSDGILRRSVPHWLRTAPLAQFVSGFEWAATSHGGDGALYVRLRKPSSHRSKP